MTRALVAAVASGLDGKGGDLGRAAAEGWELLAELDAERPEAVREVLTYPYVQAWAMRCLRPARSADLELDRAHLAGLAAAAALRAGYRAELAVPVREGSIFLPSVGALAVDAGAGRTSGVRVSPAGLSVRAGARRMADRPPGDRRETCRSPSRISTRSVTARHGRWPGG